MVSEPIAPKAARLDAQDFSTFATSDLCAKIRAVVEENNGIRKHARAAEEIIAENNVWLVAAMDELVGRLDRRERRVA